MRRFGRRQFLAGAGALGVGLLSGCNAVADSAPGAPVATPFGVPRPEYRDLLLPAARVPEGVLELYLLGGMSPWETFYAVPEFGDDADNPQQYNLFHKRGRPTLPEWIQQCGQPHKPDLVPYGADADGRQVNLGPFIYALRERPDMLARMRVWVMTHHLEPHEAAIPFAITGLPRGNPRQAALGAHVQRYHMDQQPERALPHAYTIYQSTFAVDNNGDAGSAVGLHRASARPMSVHIRPGAPLAAQLPRPAVAGFKEPLDGLVSHYAERLQARYAGLRAPGLADFQAARAAMAQHDALGHLLSPDLLEPGRREICSTEFAPPLIKGNILDETTASIRLATRLLTAPQNAARYAQVIEGGIFPDPEGQGYDSHAWHVEQQGINLNHMAQVLSDNVNRPGEGDPAKLDLDRHFVLLNTEFGRSPHPEYTVRNPQGFGTNHWPWAYVVVGFGGFIDESRAGIVGAIGGDSMPIEAVGPTEHRAAMLLAMGIWPFHEAGFAIGDIPGAADERAAAQYLRQRILGFHA